MELSLRRYVASLNKAWPQRYDNGKWVRIHTKTSNTLPFRLHSNGWGRSSSAGLKWSSTADPAKFTAILENKRNYLTKRKRKKNDTHELEVSELVASIFFFSIQTNRSWLNMSVTLTWALEGKRRRGRPRETWRRTVNKEREHVWLKVRRDVEVAGRYRVAWRRRIDGPILLKKRKKRWWNMPVFRRHFWSKGMASESAPLLFVMSRNFSMENTFHDASRGAKEVCLPVRHVHRGWHDL